MAKAYGFTESSTRRIARVVRRVEDMPTVVEPSRRLGPSPIVPTPIVRIELAEDLTEGATVEAYLLDYSYGSLVRVEDSVGTDVKIDVQDMLSTFSGSEGDKGYATKLPDNKNYELIQLECP